MAEIPVAIWPGTQAEYAELLHAIKANGCLCTGGARCPLCKVLTEPGEEPDRIRAHLVYVYRMRAQFAFEAFTT